MADTNLAELRKQCMTSLYLCSDNISNYLDDEKEAEFAKLKSYVEDYCKLEAREDVAIQALERAKAHRNCTYEGQKKATTGSQKTSDREESGNKLSERETDASNVDTLQDKFSSYLNSLANKRLNTANHPYMVDMNKRIEHGMRETRNNLEESDLAITESENRLIDPITKTPIEDPVRNSMCNHVYERASIMQLLKVKPRTKCPVAGCGNRQNIETQHLISDEELKFRLTLNAHSTMIQTDTRVLDDSM